MKKLHIILLLVCTLSIWILCWLFLNKDNGIKWISEQEIFDKNLKCQEYLSWYIEKNTPTLGWIINSVWIFYSPRENSCIGYLHYYDSWEDEEGTSRIYDSYDIDWLHWSTKKSSYTKDWWPKLWELSCEKKSDFRWINWEYNCYLEDTFNDKWKELWEKEIERLKSN
jgi:hypothetical protein